MRDAQIRRGQLVDLCGDIAARLRAVALNGDEDSTPAGWRELVNIALAV